MSALDFKIQFLIQRGKYKEAQALIRTRLAEHPSDPDLHLLLAQVLFHLGRPKEAEASARSAIGLDPESGFPYELLAQILVGSSDWKGAEEAVRQANALDGDCASRRAILARIALDQGKFERCLEHAQSGLEMDADDDVCRFYRSIALSRLGQHEAAEQASIGLLRDDPEDSCNHSARGWILLEQNATSLAKMHFQEALRLDPENEDARIGLARCLQQGNPVLGWFLRAVIALDKIPLTKLLLAAVLVGIVLPRFLRGDGMPPAVALAGSVLKTGVMSFIYSTVAVAPLFSSLLFVSREGRNALGSHESRAVKWSIAPLLAGFACLVLWIVGGGKWIPLTAIGFLCAATLLYEAFSLRHPWVRRRMLMVAVLGCGCAIWLLLGPIWLLNPLAEELSTHLATYGKNADPAKLLPNLELRLKEMVRVKSHAFAYPAIALYFLTVCSDSLVAAWTRKAPDHAD
jgi:tetratricopeptide (TPR) repeat protein